MQSTHLHKIELHTTTSSQMLAVTGQVQEVVTSEGVTEGLCHIYVPHTTAALTINENADPTVVQDVLHTVDKLIPLRDPAYLHMEGNSAAHVKSIFFGTSQTVPITDNRLVLGTWQGIFFCEFDGPRRRHFFVKVMAG
jgi:secondary thiamine-phosphate synthase enzyme